MGSINVFSAIKRPFTNLSRLLLGAILIIIPVLNLFSAGYLLECIRTSNMPRWRLRYFLDGLMALVIVLVYFIPFILLFLFITVTNIPYDSFFFIPFAVLAILTVYLVPAALVNYAKKSVFFQGVFQTAFSPDYFIAFIIGLFWAGLLNFFSVILIRVLYFVLPLSLFAIVNALVAALLLFASEITLVTLLKGASR